MLQAAVLYTTDNAEKSIKGECPMKLFWFRVNSLVIMLWLWKLFAVTLLLKGHDDIKNAVKWP